MVVRGRCFRCVREEVLKESPAGRVCARHASHNTHTCAHDVAHTTPHRAWVSRLRVVRHHACKEHAVRALLDACMPPLRTRVRGRWGGTTKEGARTRHFSHARRDAHIKRRRCVARNSVEQCADAHVVGNAVGGRGPSPLSSCTVSSKRVAHVGCPWFNRSVSGPRGTMRTTTRGAPLASKGVAALHCSTHARAHLIRRGAAR